jgi:glycerol-3-phosphate acyltransferase PlsY
MHCACSLLETPASAAAAPTFPASTYYYMHSIVHSSQVFFAACTVIAHLFPVYIASRQNIQQILETIR